MEHQVAQILTQQEAHGWHFNEQRAQELEQTLRRELEDTTELLRKQFPYVAGALFTPKRDNRTQGYVNGAELQRLKNLTLHHEIRSHGYSRHILAGNQPR